VFAKRKRKGKGLGKRKRSALAELEEDGEDATIVAIKPKPSKLRPASEHRSETQGQSADAVLGREASTRDAAPAEYGGGATTTLEIDTAHDRDGRALLERALEAEKHAAHETPGGVEGESEKVYKGMNAYATGRKFAENTASMNKVTGTHGPLRAPTNVRAICRFDYQMDICKDYFETGYCGFGDSCIFMHTRENYTTGWKQEQDWNERQKKRQARLAAGRDPDVETDDEGAEQEEGMPHACHICRGSFKDPVVTKCGHYFCERCILKRGETDGTCSICGKPTHGVFNKATKLIDWLAVHHPPADNVPASTGDGDGAGTSSGEPNTSAPDPAGSAKPLTFTTGASRGFVEKQEKVGGGGGSWSAV
jgi:RING finger protein 113A